MLGGNVPSCLSYAAADESGVLLAGGGVIGMQLRCPGCSSRCMAVVEVFDWQDGLGLRCVFSPEMAYLRRHFRAFAEPSSRAAPLGNFASRPWYWTCSNIHARVRHSPAKFCKKEHMQARCRHAEWPALRMSTAASLPTRVSVKYRDRVSEFPPSYDHHQPMHSCATKQRASKLRLCL